MESNLAQYVKYLIKMKNKLQRQSSNSWLWFDTMLNHHLFFQQLKLIKNDESNNLINILTIFNFVREGQ